MCPLPTPHDKKKLRLQSALNNLLNTCLIQTFNPQEIIISFLKLTTIPIRVDSPIDQMMDRRIIAHSKFRVGLFLDLGGIPLLNLPFGASEFFIDIKDLTLRDDRRIDKDKAVLGFLRVRKHANCGLTDLGEGGGAERAVTTIIEGSFLLGNIEAKEAGFETCKINLLA